MRGTSSLGSPSGRIARVSAPLAGLPLVALLLAGCASGPVDYARPYPSDKASTETLNVQVFRREDRISLTNTSPYEFSECTLWVNAAYSCPIKGLGIGQTIDLSLYDFRNEYSQAFHAGGFFSTVLPSAVVLTEIETDDQIYGLVVVHDRAR